MKQIDYIKLSRANFGLNSLDGFKRRQKVTHCWRRQSGGYALTPVTYTEDWDLNELKEVSEKILTALNGGATAYGAVYSGEIVGFALVLSELFGTEKQYADLAEFYVSEPFRRKGIGKRLFCFACGAAKELGAKKLYISAHSAEDSIAAYKSYGCVFATEVNKTLAEKEPCDLQLEYDLF